MRTFEELTKTIRELPAETPPFLSHPVNVESSYLRELLEWMDAHRTNAPVGRKATIQQLQSELEEWSTLFDKQKQLQALLDAAYAELGKHPDAPSPQCDPVNTFRAKGLTLKQPTFWDGLEVAKMMEECAERQSLLIWLSGMLRNPLYLVTPDDSAQSPARPS